MLSAFDLLCSLLRHKLLRQEDPLLLPLCDALKTDNAETLLTSSPLCLQNTSTKEFKMHRHFTRLTASGCVRDGYRLAVLYHTYGNSGEVKTKPGPAFDGKKFCVAFKTAALINQVQLNAHNIVAYKRWLKGTVHSKLTFHPFTTRSSPIVKGIVHPNLTFHPFTTRSDLDGGSGDVF